MKFFLYLMILVLPIQTYSFVKMEVDKIDGLKIVGTKGRRDGVKQNMEFYIFSKNTDPSILIAKAKVLALTYDKCGLKITKIHKDHKVNVGDFVKEEMLYNRDEINLDYPKIKTMITQKNYTQLYRSLMIGYAGNFPHAPLGLFAAYIPLRKAGYFIEIKSNGKLKSDNDLNYYESISTHKAADIYGDRKIDDLESHVLINFGFTYTFSINFSAYAGFGLYVHDKYQQYYDPLEILGTHGRYWVLEDDESSLTNLCCGIIFSAEKIAIPIGFDRKINGFTAGICFKIE